MDEFVTMVKGGDRQVLSRFVPHYSELLDLGYSEEGAAPAVPSVPDSPSDQEEEDDDG